MIFLGRLVCQKNPQRLISILKDVKKEIPEIKLGIIGTGDLLEEVKEIVNQDDLQKNVDFLGYQKNPFPYLFNSKIMIMTSKYEGTPMCALEAIACGVPIISTKTDGLVDIIENNKTGYLSDNNEELKKYIIDLLMDEKKLTIMKKNVFEHNKKINNINNYCMNIKNIYNRF